MNIAICLTIIKLTSGQNQKKAKHKLNLLTKKSKRKYFANIAKTESNQITKLFWNSIKPFTRNKDGNRNFQS